MPVDHDKPSVLITGAFGYIGLALLRKLVDTCRVTAFGHAPRSAAARSLIPFGVEVVEGDALEPKQLAGRRFDFAIHLAGISPRQCLSDPVAAVRAHVRGQMRLGETLLNAVDRRTLFMSSVYVYGHVTQPAREVSPTAPTDLYGALKEIAEQVWFTHDATVLRLSNVYGWIGADIGRDSAVDRFCRAARRGVDSVVFGDGRQIVDYVHIDDVVRAIMIFLNPAVILPQVINVGGGAPVSVKALAETCAKLGRAYGYMSALRYQPTIEKQTDRCLDITLAAELFDWRPKVSLHEGVSELLREYR